MKRPKWTDKTIMPHEKPDDALRLAAKALRIEAKLSRKLSPARGKLLDRLSRQLEIVACGRTWAQAFAWPPVDNEKGKKK